MGKTAKKNLDTVKKNLDILNKYDFGKVLKVTLDDTYFLHPTNSHTGSEAELSKKPKALENDWYGINVICGIYDGLRSYIEKNRPNVLKLRLNVLCNQDGKKILAVPLDIIKDITNKLE